jgi:hypothetical protein
MIMLKRVHGQGRAVTFGSLRLSIAGKGVAPCFTRAARQSACDEPRGPVFEGVEQDRRERANVCINPAIANPSSSAMEASMTEWGSAYLDRHMSSVGRDQLEPDNAR